jgi:hypothetical protein
MRVMRARRLLALVVLLAALLGAALIARPYAHGLSFVIRAAEMQGAARGVADLDTVRVSTREIAIPTRRGPMRARLYEPSGSHRRAALLTSGLHASGIDEPRLVRLAQRRRQPHRRRHTRLLAVAFELALHHRRHQEPAGGSSDAALPDHTAAVMGISFSGGLSIVAAGRPSLAGRVAYVFSLGGHDNLARVMQYLCTGTEVRPMPDVTLGVSARPPNFVLPPHDDGVAVILLSLADQMVPGTQVDRLRAGVRQYLRASALDGGVDKARPAEFDMVRSCRKRLRAAAALAASSAGRVHLGASPAAHQSDWPPMPCRSRNPEAVGAGVPAARPRGQRHPGGRIGVPGGGSARPRPGAPAAERAHLTRRGRPADARERRAAARRVLG